MLLHDSNSQNQIEHPAVTGSYILILSDAVTSSQLVTFLFLVFRLSCSNVVPLSISVLFGRDARPVLVLIMHDLLHVCLHLPLHPALRCLSHSIIIFTQRKSHYILTATVEGFRAVAGQV